MESNYIESGNRVEICMILEDNKMSKTYLSKVELALDPKEIILTMPTSKGVSVKLPKSDKYIMLFFTKNGMYRYSASVKGYSMIDGCKFLVSELINKGEKVQRREYFRFNCDISMKFHEVDVNGKNIGVGQYDGVGIDIGAGGMKFLSNGDVPLHSRIQCVIELLNDFLIISSDILYKDPSENANYKFQYRVTFLDIVDSERDIIVQYIFNEQRKKQNNSKVIVD